MESTQAPQPCPKLADQASSNEAFADEQEQQAYDYQGLKKSFVGHRAVIRGAPRKFELNNRVKMQVTENVEGTGKVVSYPIFTIQKYLDDPDLGWTYQLFDVEAKETYMGGQYYEEARLTKENRKR